MSGKLSRRHVLGALTTTTTTYHTIPYHTIGPRLPLPPRPRKPGLHQLCCAGPTRIEQRPSAPALVRFGGTRVVRPHALWALRSHCTLSGPGGCYSCGEPVSHPLPPPHGALQHSSRLCPARPHAAPPAQLHAALHCGPTPRPNAATCAHPRPRIAPLRGPTLRPGVATCCAPAQPRAAALPQPLRPSK